MVQIPWYYSSCCVLLLQGWWGRMSRLFRSRFTGPKKAAKRATAPTMQSDRWTSGVGVAPSWAQAIQQGNVTTHCLAGALDTRSRVTKTGRGMSYSSKRIHSLPFLCTRKSIPCPRVPSELVLPRTDERRANSCYMLYPHQGLLFFNRA